MCIVRVWGKRFDDDNNIGENENDDDADDWDTTQSVVSIFWLDFIIHG